MKIRHPVLKIFQAYFPWMILQYRKHCSSFQFLLRVSPKRYIFLPIIIYLGRKTKEMGVTFYYLIYFPLKFDLFIVFVILFMQFLIFCWTIHHFWRGIQHILRKDVIRKSYQRKKVSSWKNGQYNVHGWSLI